MECDTEQIPGDQVSTAPPGTGMGAARKPVGGQFPRGQGSGSSLSI